MSKFYFNLQMINDIGVHLIISDPDESNVVSDTNKSIKVTKKCFICSKYILHQEMRAHIGGHILREEVAGLNICGFCGRDVCSIELQASSKKGTTKFFKINRQDCPYFFDYGRKAASSKKIHAPIA